MTEKREKMLDEVIHLFGFEDEITVSFARLLESRISDAQLEIRMIQLRRLWDLEMLIEMLKE